MKEFIPELGYFVNIDFWTNEGTFEVEGLSSKFNLSRDFIGLVPNFTNDIDKIKENIIPKYKTVLKADYEKTTEKIILETMQEEYKKLNREDKKHLLDGGLLAAFTTKLKKDNFQKDFEDYDHSYTSLEPEYSKVSSYIDNYIDKVAKKTTKKLLATNDIIMTKEEYQDKYLNKDTNGYNDLIKIADLIKYSKKELWEKYNRYHIERDKFSVGPNYYEYDDMINECDDRITILNLLLKKNNKIRSNYDKKEANIYDKNRAEINNIIGYKDSNYPVFEFSIRSLVQGQVYDHLNKLYDYGKLNTYQKDRLKQLIICSDVWQTNNKFAKDLKKEIDLSDFKRSRVSTESPKVKSYKFNLNK